MVDLQAEQLTMLMKALERPQFGAVRIRDPKRSLLSTREIPRIAVVLYFPPSVPDLIVDRIMHSLRKDQLPGDALIADNSIYRDPGALVLTVGSMGGLTRYWQLATQMMAIGRNRFLVRTASAESTWTQVMTEVMKDTPAEVDATLRWKRSAGGGEIVAAPEATQVALAASRRRGARKASLLDHCAEVRVDGEVGREDAEVIRRLVMHAVSAAGINLREAANPEDPKRGEFRLPGARNPTARPGTAELFLRDEHEVLKVYHALDGQTVRVGGELIGITVTSDAVVARGAPGDRRRRR